jgi:hypothetical protein
LPSEKRIGILISEKPSNSVAEAVSNSLHVGRTLLSSSRQAGKRVATGPQ